MIALGLQPALIGYRAANIATFSEYDYQSYRLKIINRMAVRLSILASGQW